MDVDELEFLGYVDKYFQISDHSYKPYTSILHEVERLPDNCELFGEANLAGDEIAFKASGY